MNKKPKILKPRVLIPLIVLLLFYAFCVGYVMQVSNVNSVAIGVGQMSYVKGSLKVESSDESIVEITKVSETPDPDGINLAFEAKSVNPGYAKVNLRFYIDDSKESAGALDPVNLEFDFRVMPLGLLYNKTDDTFNGVETVLTATIGTMIILAVALLFSLIERHRKGAFSYSMVARCGLMIFFILNSYALIREWLDFSQYGASYSLRFIMQLLFDSGQMVVSLSVIPLGLLALALAVSNIWLVRHEGFRPLNLLGVFLGVVMMGGIVLMFWLMLNLSYESLASYYISTFLTVAFSFIYCYFECMLLSTIICAMLCTRYKPPYDLDYIIILGCAIRRDGTPTPLLRGRANRALSFEKSQFEKTGKHAKFVPSGGQGSDEVISEAESMKRYLMEKGVPEEQILKEDKSVNTLQNMSFSKKVIEGDAGNLEDVNIGFSTTNYHVFRGYTLADRIKMKVKGLSAKTKLYFFPNAFIREFIGLVWEQKFRHILFILLLTLGLAALYCTTVIEW